jgi:hypothetical protein
MKSEELAVGVIESNLVVALPVIRLHEAGSERQGQTGRAGPGDEFLQPRLDLGLVELVCVAAQRAMLASMSLTTGI